MNMIDALRAASSAQKPKRSNPGHKRSREVMQRNSDARWKNTFAGQELTTAQLACKLGYSHMGALSSLYKLEKREKVVRVGVVPSGGNKPAVLWKWIGD